MTVLAVSFDSCLYQPPSSNWIAGNNCWPVPSNTGARCFGRQGPRTTV